MIWVSSLPSCTHFNYQQGVAFKLYGSGAQDVFILHVLNMYLQICFVVYNSYTHIIVLLCMYLIKYEQTSTENDTTDVMFG